MEATDYPKLTSENLSHLTWKQHIAVAVEGSPALTTVFVMWFVGVIGTMITPHMQGDARMVVTLTYSVLFAVSAVIFFSLLKNGYLEKPRYDTERYFLKRMGVRKPMKFLKEHPRHLDAYLELSEDLSKMPEVSKVRDGLKAVYLPAMLVFTGPDRHTSGPLVASIIEERGVTDPMKIVELLDMVENKPPVLNEGAL